MIRRLTLLKALGVPLLAGSPASLNAIAQTTRPPHGAASPEYTVVHGWPILPDGEVLGAVAGVDVDQHGNVFVFHRSGRVWPESDILDQSPIARPTVTVFEGKSGALVRRWGANTFAMPHGLTVDAYDCVWLTDVALQQVYKFSYDGQPLLTLGERGVAGVDDYHFNRPTAVAVAADRSFYVSDGYLNTRIMKFTPEGRFLFQWGTKGSGRGQFDLPHDVAISDSGHVYVADRSNARIQVFNAVGKYLNEWKSEELGRPYAITLGKNGMAYIADGGDQPDEPPDRSALVVKSNDESTAERFGRFGNYDGQFELAHAVAVGPDNSVYVGDVKGGRVQKFSRIAANRSAV